MSRVNLTPKDTSHQAVVCGLDHVCGWFFQVFGKDDEEGEEVLIVDKDTLLSPPCSQSDMIKMIKKYAIDDRISRHCIDQIRLDYDPAAGLIYE